MTFEEVLHEALAMLQRLGRVSSRSLKRQFDLDDAYLEDLNEALLYTRSALRINSSMRWPRRSASDHPAPAASHRPPRCVTHPS